ncbi:SDR family NAD(P)-dependent oxidoreductase [Pseudotenacibaculum haliotis]|uniref:SDR family NAD(P)-dependent oxidoreductase n=1 Tax=Pseudotenacibaculum haliotis TaxID=1862138 RepID=A0ABW5LXH3_9FLAO
MQVKDKVVIVTGAGSGIGRATALHFAHFGAKVVVSDIDLEKAQKVADEIVTNFGESLPIKANVAQYEEVENLIQHTVTAFGRLDVMVNNAGIGPKQLLKTAEHTLEDWEAVIAVNQTGVFYGMKLALQQMLKQGSGNIVNVASLAGLKASINNLSYSASKFAVVGMTKSAALEYAKTGIRINAVCPGYTESALLDKLLSARPDMDTMLKSIIPMKRYGDAKEIADAIVWLASDQTKFMTGQTLILDGGTSL